MAPETKWRRVPCGGTRRPFLPEMRTLELEPDPQLQDAAVA